MALLKGKWVQVAERYLGKRTKQANPRVMIFSGEEVKTYDGANGSAKHPAVYRYTLDPSRGPKRLDAWEAKKKDPKKKYQCIYQLDGDKLLICYNANGSDAPRPTGFDTTAENVYCVLEFEREK
jgi:uncharacterized protein (TIGR03067 family)